MPSLYQACCELKDYLEIDPNHYWLIIGNGRDQMSYKKSGQMMSKVKSMRIYCSAILMQKELSTRKRGVVVMTE